MAYLLDTDVLSALLREPRGPVNRRIALVGANNICTSIIVASELQFGAMKQASGKLHRDIEGLLSRVPAVPFEAPADKFYAEIRSCLEYTGKPIGGNDMLIAAQALALGCTMVTGNEREFSRVPSLKVENWLR
jgi:tRNA(fMet)-specific endonuclease VapC